MKYSIYVIAIDGDYDRDGWYDGVVYDSLDDAKYALHNAELDESIDCVIREVCE